MIEILTGDCLDVYKQFPDGKIALAYLDPPFNQGVSYETHNDNMAGEAYMIWLMDRIYPLKRILKPGGALWVAISTKWQGWVMRAIQHIPGFLWRNTVIWHYTFGPAQETKFTPSYTPLHYFVTEGAPFIFHPARVPSARQTVYNDKRANPDGKIPDDVWTIPRVCGTFNERSSHPCQQPIELVSRVIEACTEPGDIVLDPFCGSGTTLVAAKRLGRMAIGIDVSATYCQLARERVENG